MVGVDGGSASRAGFHKMVTSTASPASTISPVPAESIPAASAPFRDAPEQCVNCAAPMASDQRYCLECGERRATVSEFLRTGSTRQAAAPTGPPGSAPPGSTAVAPRSGNNGVTLLAGIGVLLLAMGVGVLIGRSGGGSGRAPAAQVVTIAGTGSAGTGGAEEAFTSDWPAGEKG